MQTIGKWILCGGMALAGAAALTACGKTDPATPPVSASTASDQATVPPPPGDSTPKAADSATRSAMESNEKSASPGTQSTVGTAASGAPPYTLGSAPEGNAAPSQGSKAGEPVKK